LAARPTNKECHPFSKGYQKQRTLFKYRVFGGSHRIGSLKTILSGAEKSRLANERTAFASIAKIETLTSPAQARLKTKQRDRLRVPSGGWQAARRRKLADDNPPQ